MTASHVSRSNRLLRLARSRLSDAIIPELPHGFDARRDATIEDFTTGNMPSEYRGSRYPVAKHLEATAFHIPIHMQ